MFWTPEDHQRFLEGLKKFNLEDCLGPDGAELMAMFMGNRTPLQIRSHFQKHNTEKLAEQCKAQAAASREAAASRASSQGESATPAQPPPSSPKEI